MTARQFKLPLIAAWLLLLTLAAGSAYAAGCGCGPKPPPPPPPCNCTPPSPPSPPSPPCCNNINIPGVNVNVGANVVVNANAQSFAAAGAGASSGSSVYYGGGGGYWSMGEGSYGLIQNLNVESTAAPRRVAYEATRTRIRVVIIQAVCIDDKDVPHPASQVSPDREIDEHYDGELYRCIAGTHMQATLAEYHGEVSFDHGQTITCTKGEALDRSASGEIACRPQSPARDCNERSLLRRFGAGVKIVKIVTVERYTAYREETVSSAQVSSFNMTIDGGVGGMVH
jgi:hypothetical protein